MREVRLIGFVENVACDSKETRKQINELKKYKLDLVDEKSGQKITWRHLDDPDLKQSIFRAIESDRALRIDEKEIMADRPTFAAITIQDNRIVRLEFYAGHDALEKIYDFRAKELHGKKLPDYMEKDENAYDPAKFLKEHFGIDEKFSVPILKKLHEMEREEAIRKMEEENQRKIKEKLHKTEENNRENKE